MNWQQGMCSEPLDRKLARAAGARYLGWTMSEPARCTIRPVDGLYCAAEGMVLDIAAIQESLSRRLWSVCGGQDSLGKPLGPSADLFGLDERSN